MKKVFFDTETCGLHGPIVLIQYAFDDGPIHVHHVWKTPISETLELIRSMLDCTVIGFNLAFDWFHIIQLYTTLIQFDSYDQLPIDHITEYAYFEKSARDLDMCLKPASCFDLMLHARKGPYQSTMDRKPIKIKRVPIQLAHQLAAKLDQLIELKDVYFAKKKDPSKRWRVVDIENKPHFKNVELKFAPSSALKALAQDALNLDVTKFVDIEPPKWARPVETGYAPYALSPYYPKNKKTPVFPSPSNWHGKWPEKIRIHIEHWSTHDAAIKYAIDDVHFTRELYKFFKITPEMHDDDDSVLSCMVGPIRWRGYKINIPAIVALRNQAVEKIATTKFNFHSTPVCRKYVQEVMDETEILGCSIDGKFTTKSQILEKVALWTKSTVCDKCNGQGCDFCGDGEVSSDEPHPAAARAREILDFRRAKKAIELFDKLLISDRFHASVNVIGARSGRMSGADGLNAQGINHSKPVRKCFDMAWEGECFEGGDFAASQIAIADAVYGDPKLHADLLEKRVCDKCKGKMIVTIKGEEGNKHDVECPECHGTGKVRAKLYPIFGETLFPGRSYDDIVMTKGLPNEQDLYDRSKKGVLAMLFGGETHTLSTRVGISEASAEEGFHRWLQRYPTWAKNRKKYSDMFCSMTQPEGLGTRVIWKEPSDYIESMLGFRRYFTLENRICKALFNLANKPPKEWMQLKMRVNRNDAKEQTVCGALQSALYSTAFAIQSANMRAAANHVIQSPESTLVKRLQVRQWNYQPPGIHKFMIRPLNIHDELLAPCVPEIRDSLRQTITDFVTECQQIIPLMGIDWGEMKTWADK